MELDFLQELIDTPDYVPTLRNKVELPKNNPSAGSISVLRKFPGVSFNCNDRTNDIRCKATTNYLWMGDPCCLEHALPRLQELTDSEANTIDF